MTQIERLVEQYSDLVLQACCSCLNNTDDAEDVCQTVFLKLLDKDPVFESAEHEKAWIIRVAINECHSLHRRMRRLHPISESVPAVTDDPINSVLDAVMSLPDKYREALFLVYCVGYSVPETAKLLGRSENAVWSRLSRGKIMLKKKLEVDEIETKLV